MIDWLSFSLPYDGPPVGDMFMRREWDTGETVPAFNRHHQFQGSFGDKIGVHCIGRRLYITGNPVKWATGQNVVGTDDIWWLCGFIYQAVIEGLNLPDSLLSRRAIATGEDVIITRVDCTYAYHIGTDEDARAWMRAMESASHVRYRGRGHYDEGMASLMYGLTVKAGEKPKGSRRSSFKFYLKSDEIKKRPLKCDARFHDELNSFAAGHVRGEALFRKLELSRYNLHRLSRWTKETAYTLHRKWIDKMEISANVEIPQDRIKELPRSLVSTVAHWQAGHDLRAMLPRPTFYRHRKQLLQQGIDITLPPVLKPRVVPVLRILEARPVCRERGPELFSELLLAA